MTILDHKDIINRLSIKHEMSAEKIENVLDHLFKSIKECMEMPEMPSILIHNFGRFTLGKNLLERRIDFFERSFNENKDFKKVSDYEKALQGIDNYERVSVEYSYKNVKDYSNFKKEISNVTKEKKNF